jgi:two-component system sensor histidine kinase UhpB
VINDVADQFELMALVLMGAGYEVRTTTSAREGLALVEQKRPDLIISDVSMPEMDGIELCSRLRANSDLALTPILLVSAVRKDEESAIAGLKAGADDYLEAPYNPLLLIAKVERLLARYPTEKALKASQQHLQFITDTLPLYIAHCDSEGRFTFVNTKYAERLGLRREDAVGRAIVEVLGGEAYERIEPYVNIALGGRPIEFEVEVPYQQIGSRWMHCAYVPEFGVGGEVRGFVAVITDITERKRAEEALKESQESLARAQEVAHIGSWDWDLLTNSVRWSDEMYRIYGVTKEEFRGNFESAMDFTHPDDKELMMRNIGELLREHKSYDMDYRIVLPDGSIRVAQSRTDVYCDKDGRPVRMVGTVQDITGRKRAEESLRESQELFRSAFEHAAIGMALVSPDGRWLEVNHSLCEIVGYTEHEFLGMTFQAITHTDDLPANLDYVSKVLTGEARSYQMEKRYQHKLGHWVWVLLSVSLVRDVQGNPQYFIYQIQDITERKRAEEQIKNSNEQLRALSMRLEEAREEEGVRIARELHDELGGAMTGLKWDLHSVSRILSSGSIDGDTRARLQNKLGTMDGLIDSSIETVRRISSELRPTLLDDLGLTAAVEYHVKEFQKRTGIECHLQLRVDDSRLPKDYSTAIFRILQESLTNVARHSRAKRVNILLVDRDGQIILELEDNGQGFSRAGLSGKKSVGIMGMRERARQLGGELEVTSAPGKGTKVAIVLPTPSSM